MVDSDTMSRMSNSLDNAINTIHENGSHEICNEIALDIKRILSDYRLNLKTALDSNDRNAVVVLSTQMSVDISERLSCLMTATYRTDTATVEFMRELSKFIEMRIDSVE